MKKKILIIFICLLVLNEIAINVSSIKKSNDENNYERLIIGDYDPLVDITITLDILAIRSLDKIDFWSESDFFLKICINEEEFNSPLWYNTNYLYDCMSVTKNVPDDIEMVNISIQLWDWNLKNNKICDISESVNKKNKGFDINLEYNIKTGRWYGDDYNIGDSSGYGRVCGSGDGSIYKNERDCEVQFNIYQNDYDNDGLPYWIETHVYGTDPKIDNSGEDNDYDSVPIEWEHRWGFNPNIWDDHEHYDPDGDSLTNFEEYLTSDFGSDPYRKDIFLEIDHMEESPNGDLSVVPEKSKEHIKNPFHRRNIVFHIDTEEPNGGEIIPFDDNVKLAEVLEIYKDFFLHNNEKNWRRGVYHYCVFVYHCSPTGYAFSGDVPPYYGYLSGTNSFIISSSKMKKYASRTLKEIDYYFASAIMHELGHNLGMRWGNPFGCDSQLSKYPWQIGYWFYRNYKSIMNYRYAFEILDYSDGSHGRRDHNDWANIDLSYFEIPEK